jgi:sugar lactone lactonase YvrE
MASSFREKSVLLLPRLMPMNANTPNCWYKSTRLVLTAVVLLSLGIFFAWTTSKRAHLTQTSPSGELGTHVAAKASQPPQSSLPATHERTAVQLATRRLSAQRILTYGRGDGQLGMVHEKDQPQVGPESFAVGKDGTILVADVVNRRVAIYSRDGTYLRAIELPGIALGDVTTDAQGRVYVYDQVRRALHQYDAQGTPQGALDLKPADIDTRGYFHVAGNSVYFADAALRDVLVATLQDGVLTPADTTVARTTDGIHGDSGRIYSMSLDNGQVLRLQLRDPAAESVAQSVEIPLPGIVSARFAGEDEAKRFYIQTERLDGSSIALEVLAFSPSGEQLAATRMPENDYAIWIAKLVDVRTDGTIVQFLPQHEQAKLNLFAN